MSLWANAAEVGASIAIPHPISTGAAAETLNVAAEEEREKQPVSTLAGIQETRQSLELMLRWLKRLKLPELTKTVVVIEAELERAGQATAEKDWRTNLTATCP
jgi:hypothetical protein